MCLFLMCMSLDVHTGEQIENKKNNKNKIKNNKNKKK